MAADIFPIKKRINAEEVDLPDFFYECLDFFEDCGYQILPVSAANQNNND